MKSQPTPSRSVKPINTAQKVGVVSGPAHHRVRTFFASIFGSIALSLILLTILTVWLNRTLTDTNSFVKTVAPLVTKPDIQNFVADKVTDNLVKNAPPADIAIALLPPADIAATTPEQQAGAVKGIVNDSVLQIVRSPGFQKQWTETNRTAHAALVNQINSGAKSLSLDLSPLVTNVVDQIKTTKLSAISGKIDVPEDAGKLDIKGDGIVKAHTYYGWFKTGTLALVGVTLFCAVLCVWLSVHHARTARRILTGTGIIALVLAAVIMAPSFLQFQGANAADKLAAAAFAEVLFHNLQVACLILGVGCLVIAIGWKLIERAAKPRNLNIY